MSRKKIAPKEPEATGFLVADGQGGFKPVTAEQLLEAARELATRRLARGTPLNSPSEVRECLPALLGSYNHERFGVLFLDSQNRLIAYEEMFRGTVTSTVVYPREIVKAALGHNATSVILAHNHPSGTLEPSQADIQITQRVKEEWYTGKKAALLQKWQDATFRDRFKELEYRLKMQRKRVRLLTSQLAVA